MIRLIDPDEAVTVNGVPITGRQLAEARQELSHRGVYNPRWSELSEHDQETAAISAGSWLRALTDLVPTAGDASGYTCDGCQAQADFWDADGAPRCHRCKAFEGAAASAPVDPRRAARAADPHAHACVSCSPNGVLLGPGCINCRGTGMDQTPCMAPGHHPQCPHSCCGGPRKPGTAPYPTGGEA